MGKRIVLLLVSALIGVLLFAGCGNMKQMADIPNLVGKNVEEARKEAESQNFKMVVSEQEYRTDIKADCVVSQSPAAAQQVAQGETVSVVVSLGALQVPNLSGLSFEDAGSLIKARGLEVGKITYEVALDYRPGIVIRSVPPYGAGISGGEKIDLVVSKAP